MNDSPDYAAMAALIDRLDELNGELRDLGEEGSVPAVERNAERIDAALRALRTNVPPELYEEGE